MHEQKNKAATYAVAPEARPICSAGKYGKERREKNEPQILRGQFAEKGIVFFPALEEIRKLKRRCMYQCLTKRSAKSND